MAFGYLPLCCNAGKENGFELNPGAKDFNLGTDGVWL